MLRSAEPIFLSMVPYAATAASQASGKIDLAMHAAQDVGFIPIYHKCEVWLAMAVVKTLFAGSAITTASIHFDKRPAAGSDTNRLVGSIAMLKFGVTGASAVGDVVYDASAQGTILWPGEEVVVKVGAGVGAGGTCTGGAWPSLWVRMVSDHATNLTRTVTKFTATT